MLGTFLGLETATRGLQAMQAAIETAAHNIDNANTPGYTRQRVELVASTPLPDPSLPGAVPGQIGTGVQVEKIARLRDSFLDSQYWAQNQYLGQWTVQQDTLQKISAIINEPSDTGLATVMQNFWNAWDKLSANPSDLSARTLVVQTGVTVAQTLNQMANQLVDLQNDLAANVNTMVTQVNGYLDQIAELNRQIDSVLAVGDTPNDLLDRRDYLVDQLSNLVDVSVSTDANGKFQLQIAGQIAVDDQQAKHLFDDKDPSFDPATEIGYQNVTGGQLYGLLQSQQLVSDYQADLNAFANGLANGPITVTLAGDWTLYPPSPGSPVTLPVDVTIGKTTYGANSDASLVPGAKVQTDALGNVTSVTIPKGTTITINGLNALEQMGYDANGNAGQPFFVINPSYLDGDDTPTPSDGDSDDYLTAANITVNPALISDVSQLAAGLSNSSGDGTLAITISSLKGSQVSFSDPSNPSATMPLTQGTLDSFLQAVVGQLGVQGQQANQEVANQQALVQQIDMQRQSVDGVSIDEEMSNVIRYQQAYNASAKLISVINDLLNTLMQNV